MGLGPIFLDDLIALKRRGYLKGAESVAEIGAQQLANSFLGADKAIAEVFQLFGKARPDLGEPIKTYKIDDVEHQPDEAPSSRAFWTALGLRYTSFEYGGISNSVPLDLNHDSVPADYRRKFDLVINTGTTEHVVNQDNAFRVIHDLLRPGGISMHELPAGGALTHGLFSYNIVFFHRLVGANGYEPIILELAAHGQHPVPDMILRNNRKHSSGRFDLSGVMPTEFAIRAALRKTTDKPYMTPLDLPQKESKIRRLVSKFR